MINEQPANRELLITDALGIYIPQQFAKNFTDDFPIEQEDKDILLAGPDHEHYWQTWEQVLEYARYKEDGITYCLEQDGDLFAVDTDMPDMEMDAFMGPTGPLGSRVSLSIEGKHIGTYSTFDEALAEFHRHCDNSEYWPDLWWISDHGNVTRIKEIGL